MTTDIAQPDRVENVIWLISLMALGLAAFFLVAKELAWTRQYLKKSREREQAPRTVYHFGMEHEVLVQPVVAEARRQIAQGLNIYQLKAVNSDAAMHDYGEKNKVPPGRIVHRTDVDVLYVYTGVVGPGGSLWRPVQWSATPRYLSEVSRLAPSHVAPPASPPKPEPISTDLVLARRRFLPLNKAQE